MSKAGVVLPKARVLIVGPIPPPYMGPSLATQILLQSGLSEHFDLYHLNTSHHKSWKSLGSFSMSNIWAALVHSMQLVLLMVKKRPDIIYIPISQTTIGYLRDSIFILIGKIFRCKVIAHLRGGYFRKWLDGTNFIVRRYVYIVHSFVDAQIVLGECLRSVFHGLVPCESIFVVPNGRDFDWSPSQGKCGDRKKLRVLFLGNLIESKGALDVLKSAKVVWAEGCDVEFLFAGAWRDDRVKNELEAQARKNKDNAIKLLGTVVGRPKADLLLGADIFVFPTYYPFEGHPWVIVEAMAAGLPIITTDHAAIRESVLQDVNGFIVEKQNSQDIARRIVQLCQDDGLRQAMGVASRIRYEKYFTERAMLEQLIPVFRSVVA